MKHYEHGIRVAIDDLATMAGGNKKPITAGRSIFAAPSTKDVPATAKPVAVTATPAVQPSNAEPKKPPAGAGFLQNMLARAKEASDVKPEPAIKRDRSFAAFSLQAVTWLLATPDEHRFDADRIAAQLTLAAERTTKAAAILAEAGKVPEAARFLADFSTIHGNPIFASPGSAEKFERSAKIAATVFGGLSKEARHIYAAASPVQPPSGESSIDLVAAIGKSLIRVADVARDFSFLLEPERLAADAVSEIVEAARDTLPQFMTVDMKEADFAAFMCGAVEYGTTIYLHVHADWRKRVQHSLEMMRIQNPAEYERFSAAGLDCTEIFADFRAKFMAFSKALSKRMAGLDRNAVVFAASARP